MFQKRLYSGFANNILLTNLKVILLTILEQILAFYGLKFVFIVISLKMKRKNIVLVVILNVNYSKDKQLELGSSGWKYDHLVYRELTCFDGDYGKWTIIRKLYLISLVVLFYF